MDDQPAKPATIEDVARLAGVSIATVSRALHTPDKVARSTRSRVTAAVARTGYTANAMARNLRMRRSQMVMVLAPSISDPNFPGILIGLEKAAIARGYGVLIGNTDGHVPHEENYLKFLATGMVDGLILLTGHVPVADWLQSPAASFPPMVAATRPTGTTGIGYVGVDDVATSTVATEYLLSIGHRRIVHVAGPAGEAVSDLREEGYRTAMAGQGAGSVPWKMDGDGTGEGGRAAVERLFIRDDLPTAFFCYNDATAIGVISALQLRGYRVPEDFSVVGFDDIPFASSITPSLTTIRQPRSQIGRLAMDQLLDSLANRSAPPDPILLHGDLVVRNSSAQLRPAK